MPGRPAGQDQPIAIEALFELIIESVLELVKAMRVLSERVKKLEKARKS